MHNRRRKPKPTRGAWPVPSQDELIRAATREALRGLLAAWIARLDRELGDGKEPR
ncbi:MAG: hypothetical protein HS116_18325 [Planctomycetes bacterium]|nr:hypothetical protein [Planctomycetota bacterium]